MTEIPKKLQQRRDELFREWMKGTFLRNPYDREVASANFDRGFQSCYEELKPLIDAYERCCDKEYMHRNYAGYLIEDAFQKEIGKALKAVRGE